MGSTFSAVVSSLVQFLPRTATGNLNPTDCRLVPGKFSVRIYQPERTWLLLSAWKTTGMNGNNFALIFHRDTRLLICRLVESRKKC